MTADENNIIRLKNIIEGLGNSTCLGPILNAHVNADLKEWIKEYNPLLKDDRYTTATRIYWIINNITEFPKCATCGKPIENVKSVFKGYNTFCSKTCSNKNENVKEKIAQVNLEKYGTRCSANNSEVKAKMEATNLERYGCKCSFGNKEIREKIKQTNREKYGVDVASKLKSVQEKMEQTNLERYGVRRALQSKIFKEKVIKTCQSRYGVDYACQTEEVKEKIKESSLKHYGVEHPCKTQIVKDKIIATSLRKYGTEYPQQSQEIKQKILVSQYTNIYRSYINSLTLPLFSCDDFVAYKLSYSSEPLTWKCLECGNEFTSNVDMNLHWNIKENVYGRCPHCHPIQMQSSSEKDLSDYIQSIYSGPVKIDVYSILHEHKKMQLDVYIPEKNLAFEFDGLYWHCEINNPKSTYHLNKTLLCEKQGIHLVHIFESEWVNKNEIAKSRIKNILGLTENKIFARKCEVKLVSSENSKNFQIENHIQGFANFSVSVGLYFNDELVSLMTFGTPRFNNICEWELLRFCNKLNTTVVGGAGKLLKFFIKEYTPKSIISYADRRWSTGNLYEKLGFTLEGASKPNFWYFKINDSNLILENRVKYQKQNLSKFFKNFNSELTEIENMKNNGYTRIFDCGNLVYIMNLGDCE